MWNFLSDLVSALLLRISYRYRRWRDTRLSQKCCQSFAECGPGLHIYSPCEITGAENAYFGENVHINRGAFIRAEGGLRFGNNVHVARNLTIYTINHNYMGEALPYDETMIKKPVVIGDNVWIGINVTIVPGVTIGEGAIVGAGSVVAKDVPPLAIVGGSPARVLKYRDKEHYERLLQEKKFGGVNGKLYIPQDKQYGK